MFDFFTNYCITKNGQPFLGLDSELVHWSLVHWYCLIAKRNNEAAPISKAAL